VRAFYLLARVAPHLAGLDDHIARLVLPYFWAPHALALEDEDEETKNR
jgi:hypothetical protein